jgi:hypothetical protein
MISEACVLCIRLGNTPALSFLLYVHSQEILGSVFPQ